MGKQSARMYYQGKDHKDIFFKGKFHQKMFKGKNLVWEKLYRYFWWSHKKGIFDMDSKILISDADKRYLISDMKNNISCGIGLISDRETSEWFFAITKDEMIWKRIKEIDVWTIGGDYTSARNSFSLTENGFFIFMSGNHRTTKETRQEIYLITIESGLEYKSEKIYSSNEIIFRYVQLYGISDSFYAIRYDRAREYIMYRIKRDGSVSSQQMLGNFVKDDVNMSYGGMGILANNNGDIYILCPNADASNGGTYIFHAAGLSNVDYPTIAFAARNSRFLEGYVCGIDIVYDSYQIMFIAHNESRKTGNIEHVYEDSYKKSEFYVLDAAGNTLRVIQKDGTEGDMYVKCIGLEGVDSLGIRFSQEGRISSRHVDPKTTGYIYYKDITKGISSRGMTSLEIGYDKSRNDRCFIGYYYWSEDMTSRGREMVIYFDNLFWNESENNFAVVIGED